jgi:hypothetical protein
MGFLDKAKKLAEQAQSKMDEVQKDFNAKQGSGSGSAGSAVEYDQHGRTVEAPPPTPTDLPATDAAALSTPVGDPLPEASSPRPADDPNDAPTLDPSAPGAAPDAAPAKAEGDPLLSGETASRHGSDADKTTSPPSTGPGGAQGMTSGDPLGG